MVNFTDYNYHARLETSVWSNKHVGMVNVQDR